MKDLNDEYYVVFKDTSKNLVSIDGYIEPDFPLKRPAPEPHTVEIYITSGGKKNPKFVDMHFQSLTDIVMQKKVVEILEKFNLYKVQLLKGTHGEVIEQFNQMYYKLWCYNHILCLDLEKSKYGSKEADNTWVYDLETIVLDSERLGQVPLEQRLMFYLAERPQCLIVHQSVVDELSKHDFIGASYIPVKSWGLDSVFD
jgi:hypothetical protein